MTNLLRGKRVIVTGGSRGIGFAIAAAFIDNGVSTIEIWGLNREKGLEAAEILKQRREDVQVVFRSVNVGDFQEVKAGVDDFIATFGGVDILVNNAGITKDKLLMRMSEDDWNQVITANLTGVFNTCSAVVTHMLKAKKGGSIINVSSVVGLTGSPGQTNYAASKAGVIGFSKSLAKEVAGRNIRVNCIAPGFIETDMTAGLNETLKTEWIQQIPLKRAGLPQEIGSVAVFLGSEMSSYITAQVLVVDGGMVPF